MVYQNCDAQFFQLFFHFRHMADHGVFNGQAAFFAENTLVVRCIVFACIEDIARLHGGAGDQIDVFDGLLQHRNIFSKSIWRAASFGNYQKTTSVSDGDQRITAVVVVYGKLVSVFQKEAALRLPVVPQFVVGIAFGTADTSAA